MSKSETMHWEGVSGWLPGYLDSLIIRHAIRENDCLYYGAMDRPKAMIPRTLFMFNAQPRILHLLKGDAARFLRSTLGGQTPLLANMYLGISPSVDHHQPHVAYDGTPTLSTESSDGQICSRHAQSSRANLVTDPCA